MPRISGGVPILGTLEDTLRKASDTDFSLHRGQIMSARNLKSGGGEEWRVRGTGHNFLKGIHERGMEEGSIYWEPRVM